MTARSLIARAFRLLGVLAAGETPAAQEETDAFEALNAFVGILATQRLSIPVEERHVYPLTSGIGTYTLGPGGDFDQARPVTIPRASVIVNSTSDQPLELGIEVLDTQQFQSLPVKNVQSAIPLCVYPDYAFPLMNVTFWPVPNVVTLEAVLYTPTALVNFANLTATYVAPPGYEEMFAYNLALRLAAEYGRPVDPDVRKFAMDGLALVKKANIRMVELTLPAEILARSTGKYNWRSDTMN